MRDSRDATAALLSRVADILDVFPFTVAFFPAIAVLVLVVGAGGGVFSWSEDDAMEAEALLLLPLPPPRLSRLP